MIKLQVFKTKAGKEPFTEWLRKLKDIESRVRIRKRIERLELGSFGDTKQITKEIYELRFFFGPGYRIYFGKKGGTVVILLCGGDKSTQTKDIKKAEEYWQEYKENTNE